MKTGKALALVITCGALIAFVTLHPAKAHGQQSYTQQIVNGGTSTFQGSATGSDGLQSPEVDPAVDLSDDGSGSTLSGTGTLVSNRTIGQGAGQGPNVKSGKKAKSNPILNLSFDGLNHRNQRLANNGNQFSLEPPDQGLCAGNGFVMEAVNDVVRIFDTAGNPLTGVVDLNTFYGYAAAIVRGNPSTFGPELTDPSCYFDPDTQRWFLVVLTLDRASNGAFLGTNHLDIAVSTTSSPLGSFNIYKLFVQDDGTQGTPNHHCAGGPCLGDFPHIGADANGFYITTNEFPFFANGFHASQIYALSKQALASGAASVTVTQFDTVGLAPDGNPGFTVWPASTPASAYETGAGGTEYFVSSVAIFSTTSTDSRLIVWALSNTQSLSSTAALTLSDSFINVQTYGRPPKADQLAGNFPLGQCLNDAACSAFLIGGPDPFVETESNHVDTSDSRIQSVVFGNGKLWAVLDTAATMTTGSGTQTKSGIAYFIITPSLTPLSGSVVKQGVLALADNNLSYGAAGITSAGRGVIAFTLLGAGGSTNPGNFPTAAYASLDAIVGAGSIQTAAAGLGPEDGFTAYKFFVGPSGRNRWGDYGAAVADGNSVWIASEYIGQTCTLAQYEASPFGSCSGTRTSLGNWDTRISKLTP